MIAVTDPLTTVLELLPDSKGAGPGKFSARCPAHPDRNASLSVSTGADGRVLLYCHAGCETPAVCAALGIHPRDLFPPRDRVNGNGHHPQAPTNGHHAKAYPTAELAFAAAGKPIPAGYRFTQAWTYHDADGAEVLRVGRWDGTGSKTFRPVHSTPDGWKVGDPPGALSLYGLPVLSEGDPVFVTEGERAADALTSLGLTATTSAHGSKSAAKTDWRPLAGRNVVIFPDNDAPGEKYASDVVRLLHRLDPPPTVRVVRPPNLPDGGDAVEFIEAGGTAEQLETLASQSSPTVDTDEIPAKQSKAGILSTPLPKLRREPPPAFVPFPVDELPEPIRSYVVNAADTVGCDPAYVAPHLLTAVASAIGNTRSLQLKNGWSEPSVLWTATVGDSGTMKSPGFEVGIRPLSRRQNRLYREHGKAMAAHKQKLSEWRGMPKGDRGAEPEAPACPRLTVDDATVEALADRFGDAPRGLLLAREELSGWLSSFNQYKSGGKGGDASNFLKMHGARSLTVDRKTGDRKTIYIPRAAVSVAGTIQPGALRRALTPEFLENGMGARILLAYPPRRRKKWTEQELDPAIEQQVNDVFDRLLLLQGEADIDGDTVPKSVPLSSDAKSLWIAFVNRTGHEQLDRLGEAQVAAWSKLEGYAGRLALILHELRVAASDPTVDEWRVDDRSVKSGIALARWFGNEAERVYAMLSESEDERDGRRLCDLVASKGGTMTPRELTRSGRRYPTSASAELALMELVELGMGRWVVPQSSGKAGRPSDRYFELSAVDEMATNHGQSGDFVSVDTQG